MIISRTIIAALADAVARDSEDGPHFISVRLSFLTR
jgi:hypothetical protein